MGVWKGLREDVGRESLAGFWAGREGTGPKLVGGAWEAAERETGREWREGLSRP